MVAVAEAGVSFDLSTKSPKVFEQYGYVKTYCSDEKIAEWRTKKTPTEERWVDVFKHLETQEVPYADFASIIEYILCLPGSSAPVERIFSSIQNVWTKEKSQLQMATLESIMYVKNNLDYTCIDFYHFLKTKPDLLRQISSAQKYESGASTSFEAALNASVMSVDDDEMTNNE